MTHPIVNVTNRKSYKDKIYYRAFNIKLLLYFHKSVCLYKNGEYELLMGLYGKFIHY